MMSKSNLKLFQEQFVGFINDDASSNDLLKDILPAGRIPNFREALEVHQNGYIARLTEALGETFEGTWFIMGDELFFSICEEYIKENKSKLYNLSDYGENFPNFLEQRRDMIAIPFVQDMARFDWMFKELFHEKQHISIPLNELQRIETEPNISLILGNAVRLFSSQFSIYKFWNLRNQTDAEIKNINYESSENLLLYKQNEEIFVKELSDAQFDIISSLISGKSVASVLEMVNSENQNDLVSVFQIIGSSGIVAGIKC